MRYILRGNQSVDGLQNSIIDKLDACFDVERAIVFDCSKEDKNMKDYISYFPIGELLASTEQSKYEGESLALDRELLHGMLPYKDMIMDLMKRETNLDIYYYKELSDLYYKMLGHFYSLIKHERIDYILWMVSPHHAGEYVLYALAEILGINKLLLNSCWNTAYFVYGDSIPHIGRHVKEEYSRLLKETKNFILNEEIQGYYMSKKGNIHNKVDIEARNNEIASLSCYFDLLTLKQQIKSALRVIKWTFGKNENKKMLSEKSKRMFVLAQRARKLRKDMLYKSDYEKMCEDVISDKKYIYFGLQFQPEQTTMPNAGEYRNQLLSISILAEAAKRHGVEVWVKEHYVQYCREKSFYHQLKMIDNVRLIRISEDTNNIMNGALAVATQTGSCIIEGMIKGKPALIFGEGYPYKGAPNTFLISSIEQCSGIIFDIVNGRITEVPEERRIAYMKAFENTCILSYIDDIRETSKYYNMDTTAERIVELVKETYTVNR